MSPFYWALNYATKNRTGDTPTPKSNGRVRTDPREAAPDRNSEEPNNRWFTCGRSGGIPPARGAGARTGDQDNLTRPAARGSKFQTHTHHPRDPGRRGVCLIRRRSRSCRVIPGKEKRGRRADNESQVVEAGKEGEGWWMEGRREWRGGKRRVRAADTTRGRAWNIRQLVSASWREAGRRRRRRRRGDDAVAWPLRVLLEEWMDGSGRLPASGVTTEPCVMRPWPHHTRRPATHRPPLGCHRCDSFRFLSACGNCFFFRLLMVAHKKKGGGVSFCVALSRLG
jgi:hypothetical protein